MLIKFRFCVQQLIREYNQLCYQLPRKELIQKKTQILSYTNSIYDKIDLYHLYDHPQPEIINSIAQHDLSEFDEYQKQQLMVDEVIPILMENSASKDEFQKWCDQYETAIQYLYDYETLNYKRLQDDILVETYPQMQLLISFAFLKIQLYKHSDSTQHLDEALIIINQALNNCHEILQIPNKELQMRVLSDITLLENRKGYIYQLLGIRAYNHKEDDSVKYLQQSLDVLNDEEMINRSTFYLLFATRDLEKAQEWYTDTQNIYSGLTVFCLDHLNNFMRPDVEQFILAQESHIPEMTFYHNIKNGIN